MLKVRFPQQKSPVAFVFAAGEFGAFSLAAAKYWLKQFEADQILCIAVDGGIHALDILQIVPHIYLGDMDSSSSVELKHLPLDQVLQKVYPVKKDKTDLHLAYDFMQSLGIEQCIVFGALGARLDHTLANLQLLQTAKQQGIWSYLVGEQEQVLLLNETENIVFSQACEGVLSLFSWNSPDNCVQGLQVENAEYSTLPDFVLKQNFPMGVSNRFLKGKSCAIQFKAGNLLVVYEKQKDFYCPFVVFSKEIDYN